MPDDLKQHQKMVHRKFSFLVMPFACGIISCAHNPEKIIIPENKNVPAIQAQIADTAQKRISGIGQEELKYYPPGATDLYFQPYLSTLTGTVKLEMFYGPPGFGDNPATDEKEFCYVLILDKKVNVLLPPETSGSGFHDFDEEKRDVEKMQLDADSDSGFKTFVNKKVSVKGTLFGRITPGQFTDVLINVRQITE